MKGSLDTLGELPDKTLRNLKEINEAIEKLAEDMERTKPDCASEYPDVGAERDKVFVSLVKLRLAEEKEDHTAADRNKKKEQIDSTSTVSGLVKSSTFGKRMSTE